MIPMWLSRLALKFTGPTGNRADDCGVDSRRIRSELAAIRVRFPDHA